MAHARREIGTATAAGRHLRSLIKATFRFRRDRPEIVDVQILVLRQPPPPAVVSQIITGQEDLTESVAPESGLDVRFGNQVLFFKGDKSWSVETDD